MRIANFDETMVKRFLDFNFSVVYIYLYTTLTNILIRVTIP